MYTAMNDPAVTGNDFWNIFLLNANGLMVNQADISLACTSDSKIKQLTTRTSHASGLSNLIFTLGYGYFGGAKALKATIDSLYAPGVTCYN